MRNEFGAVLVAIAKERAQDLNDYCQMYCNPRRCRKARSKLGFHVAISSSTALKLHVCLDSALSFAVQ